MSVAVRFGGTSGDYHSIEDINLLDADTAHCQQTTGAATSWNEATGFATSTALTPVFGTSHGSCDLVAAKTLWGILLGPASASAFPVSAATEYSASVSVAATDVAAGTWEFYIGWVDSGGSFLGYSSAVQDTLTPDDDWLRLEITATSHASAAFAFLRASVDNDSLTGSAAKMYWDAAVLRAGSDATFVSSLNVVGTLGESKDPSGLTVGYAADGSPLTIGKSWSGDGVSYVRYDGAVNVGPIVCKWDAEDWINV